MTVESCLDAVLRNMTFDLKFKQFARYLAIAIKETPFFSGMSPKWRAYWIITELTDRYYGKKNYPYYKKDLKAILAIQSPVSNDFTKDNPKVIQFRKEFDEIYDALELKQKQGESNYHNKNKLTR
jgi:hypothetical protein